MSEAEDASGKGSNLTAVEAISAKLAEVTRLAEKLDAKLCEAGARTRPVPMPASVVSSNSSLFSSSTVLSAPASSSGQPQSVFPGSSSSTVSPIPHRPVCPGITPVSTGMASGSGVTTAVCETMAVADPVTSGLASPELMVQSAPTSELSPLNGTAVPVRISSPTPVQSELSRESIIARENGGSPSPRSPLPEEAETQDEEELNKEGIEKSFDESAAEDSNMDGYVTATECSMTPTARSRSESFVTSPECEDLAALATVTSTLACSSCWNTEDSKIPTTATGPTVSSSKEDSVGVKEEVSKPEEGREDTIEKVISMEKMVEERSGKVVKEVTETTTLRVSHDTRLGVASYKVTSNTVQDHHESVDVKELKNLERMVSSDGRKKATGSHSTADGSLLKIVDSHTDSPRKIAPEDSEFTTKLTKVCEIAQEETSQLGSKGTKEISLSLKEYTRHHEDSGIEMSPTKREDTLEADDFLERARTVSLLENGERSRGCCSCNCSNEAACFARYSAMPVQPNFVGLPNNGLVNETQRRLSLPNPS